MSADTIYFKIDKNVRITSRQVQLGEIAQIFCSEKPVESKVKTLRLPTECISKPGRYMYSVIDVIRVINQEYPQAEVSNLGEADFILTMEKKPADAAWSWVKIILVCLLSFFGAAFSIMAFNNDVGIQELFGRLYEIFTGEVSSGFTLLEISYSVGVGLGILIFFHHFARKKHKSDPTPLEVQMRTYEDDVNTTLIEAAGRGQKSGRQPQ